MNADQNHPFTIRFVGSVVIYFFGVPRAHLTNINGRLDKGLVQAKIIECGNLANPPAHLVAINNLANPPANLLRTDVFYLCLIRNVEDENDVFLQVPVIKTLRRHWSVLYCNVSGLDLSVEKTSVIDVLTNEKWGLADTYHGMIFLRKVRFSAYEHDESSDEDGPAPADLHPVMPVNNVINLLNGLDLADLLLAQLTLNARLLELQG